mmetsp:Transcript_7399/g.21823  ORF Transcript_7399/g.21823 Transcript_7399/m.21823 type:complete len:103 (+) Transcript_7399:778-1086(+)
MSMGICSVPEAAMATVSMVDFNVRSTKCREGFNKQFSYHEKEWSCFCHKTRHVIELMNQKQNYVHFLLVTLQHAYWSLRATPSNHVVQKGNVEFKLLFSCED